MAFGDSMDISTKTEQTNPNAKLTQALSLLQGSQSNIVQCALNFVASIGMYLAGALMMVEQKTEDCEGVGLARGWGAEFTAIMLYALVNATMGAAKAIRDHYVSGLVAGTAKMRLLRPSTAHLMYQVASFLLTVGWSFSVLGPISQYGLDWVLFFAMGNAYVISSCLAMARASRDRSDYEGLQLLAKEGTFDSGTLFTAVSDLVRGTLGNKIVAWLSFPLALLTSTLVAWLNTEMQFSWRLLVTMGYLFMVSSVLQLQKLVRDLRDPIKAKDLQKQTPYKILVITSFIVSTVVTFVVIMLAELSLTLTMTMLMGFFYILGSSINLAKLVRDKQEISRIEATFDEAAVAP